jgi:hypothetical protein
MWLVGPTILLLFFPLYFRGEISYTATHVQSPGGGGGVIYLCQGFLPCMMPSMDGRRDGWMDGQVT